MNVRYTESVIDKIKKAFSEKDWALVKQLNSELADYEINERVPIFSHKPEVVQIELTSKCNAQCVMCSHYYELNDYGKEASGLAMQRFESMLPYCKLVLLNGYGEPFISKNFIDCLRLLKKYNVKAIVTTNLSVLTEEMCELIPDVFREINVSCNGHNDESYNSIHKGLKFGTFSSNLSRLVDICDSVTISLSCVAMLETVKWASDIVRFAHQKRIKKVRFGRLGVSDFIRNYDQDLTNYPNYAAYHFNKAKKLADDYHIEISYPENYQINIDERALIDEMRLIEKTVFRYDQKYQSELRSEFKIYRDNGTYGQVGQELDSTDIVCSGICDWVGKGIYMDTSGVMYTCCESKYCNYDDWNGKDAQLVRTEFFNGRLPDFCKNCPFIINNELRLLRCEKVPALYRANNIVPLL